MQNARIKKLIHWSKKPGTQKKDGICIVEGEREIMRAILSGWLIRDLFLCEESDLVSKLQEYSPILCSKDVFSRLVVRQGTIMSLAVFERPIQDLSNLDLPKNPLLLILDGLEKPGNVGALLRTANSVGVDAVIFSSLKCDPLGTNSIRNSMGGIFNTQWAQSNSSNVQKLLVDLEITPYLMHLSGAKSPFEMDFIGPSAIILGSEDKGLGPSWEKIKSHKLKIPMNGIVDSLNVSVAGAIILYEVLRQRSI